MNAQPSFETLVARGKVPGHSYANSIGNGSEK